MIEETNLCFICSRWSQMALHPENTYLEVCVVFVSIKLGPIMGIFSICHYNRRGKADKHLWRIFEQNERMNFQIFSWDATCLVIGMILYRPILYLYRLAVCHYYRMFHWTWDETCSFQVLCSRFLYRIFSLSLKNFKTILWLFTFITWLLLSLLVKDKCL